MRIWSLHPRHLDRQGLIACWRETLLAQAVLRGETRGYRSHPQLERFRAQPDPAAAVGEYLHWLTVEAAERGYRFDAAKVRARVAGLAIPVTEGQLDYEAEHLRAKLTLRDPERLAALGEGRLEPHPVLRAVPGGIEAWERPHG